MSFANPTTFETLLSGLGMTKRSFAEATQTPESTVYGWKEAPAWTIAILQYLTAQAQSLRDFGIKVG